MARKKVSILNRAPSRPKRSTSRGPVSTPVTVVPIASLSHPLTSRPVFVVITQHPAVPTITPAVVHKFNDTLRELAFGNRRPNSHSCVALTWAGGSRRSLLGGLNHSSEVLRTGHNRGN